MGLKAAALLWNRRRITLAAGATDIDTGLTQPNRSFPSYSPNEPPFGVTAAVSPPNGTPPASRIQVMPEAPIANWATVTHGEPYLSTVTNTVHVLFTNASQTPVTINAFFLDPHAMIGPGQADTYNP